MNRYKFLSELAYSLANFSEEEKRTILDFYNQKFIYERIINQKNDNEIINDLGGVEQVRREVLKSLEKDSISYAKISDDYIDQINIVGNKILNDINESSASLLAALEQKIVQAEVSSPQLYDHRINSKNKNFVMGMFLAVSFLMLVLLLLVLVYITSEAILENALDAMDLVRR